MSDTVTTTTTEAPAAPAATPSLAQQVAAMAQARQVPAPSTATQKGAVEPTPAPPADGTPMAPEEKAAEAEAKPAEKTDEPPKDRLSKQFVALSRKEKELVRKQKELTAREQSVQERAQKAEQFEAQLKRAKLDPLKFVQDQLGITWEQLVEAQLNGGASQSSPAAVEQLVEDRLAAFKSEQAELQAKAEEAKKAEDAREIAAFNAEAVKFVDDHPDDYELTRLYDSARLVPELIHENFRSTGQVLSAKEAADMVEQYLLEEASKLEATKKWQARSGKPKAEAEGKPQDQQDGAGKRAEQTGGASRTLSNRMAPSASSQATKTLSAQDRQRRAEEAVKAIWAQRGN